MPGLNIPPTVWGPFFWHTMHLAALGYPKEPTYSEKRAAKEFYESLAYLIPCPVCKEHYADQLKKNPITPSLDTRKDLFLWTLNIHNIVNKSLGKPELTEQDSIVFYAKLGAAGRSPVWTSDDFQSAEYKSFLIGAGSVIGIGLAAGALAWIFSKSKE
jgi:hypothetical protein